MSLLRRSVTSISWTVFSNTLYLVIVLVRSILLARWLAPEIFGVYAGAAALVAITAIMPGWGMEAAFLHRAEAVEDEQEAAAAHFTLKTLLTIIWVGLVSAYLFLFDASQNQTAVIVILLCTALSHLTETPRLILTRRVIHRRLALLRIVIGVGGTAVALTLARMALGRDSAELALYALLSVHIVTAISNIVFLYVWRPVWRPRLIWLPATMRYFMNVGSKNLVAAMLLRFIDKIDDLYTKVALGDAALGFYSRAYTFATYPRELIARPITGVATGVYAELIDDRVALSKAFFRSNAIIIRTSFLLGGILYLVAPEWVELLLTAKWLPMVDIFRIMLFFTLLDPIRMTAAFLMIAMGRADKPIVPRVIQAIVLIVGLWFFGRIYGTQGVAIAVNITLLVGIIIIFTQVREYVDYSVRRLFGVPALAAILAAAITIWAGQAIPLDALLGRLLLKSISYGGIFLLVMLLLEGKESLTMALKLRR